MPVEFILPKDLEYLNKVVANNGIVNVVQKPAASIKYNFLKQMSWKESQSKIEHQILRSSFALACSRFE